MSTTSSARLTAIHPLTDVDVGLMWAASGESPNVLLADPGNVTSGLSVARIAKPGVDLVGTAGEDTLRGQALDDTLSGDAGDDKLVGGAGDDQLDGGEGSDRLLGGTGNDTLSGGAGNDSLEGGMGDDTLEGGEGADHLHGGAGIDTLSGGAGNDDLHGGKANDILEGGDGDDTLDGCAGADTVAGGDGDDTYVVDNAGDVVSEFGAAGIDTVRSKISWTLGDNLENLELMRSARSGTGNDLDNAITGTRAANRLDGGAGNDTLDGGFGGDSLIGGGGADSFVFSAPLRSKPDRIADFTPGTDTMVLDRDVFGALDIGPLAPGSFRAGAGVRTAADGDDHVLYDTTTGTLYYDADGAGGRGAMKFGMLTGAPDVTADDFDVQS